MFSSVLRKIGDFRELQASKIFFLASSSHSGAKIMDNFKTRMRVKIPPHRVLSHDFRAKSPFSGEIGVGRPSFGIRLVLIPYPSRIIVRKTLMIDQLTLRTPLTIQNECW